MFTKLCNHHIAAFSTNDLEIQGFRPWIYTRLRRQPWSPHYIPKLEQLKVVTSRNEGVSLIFPMSWKQTQQEAAGHLPTHWLFFHKLFSSAAGLADQQKPAPTRWLFFSTNFLHRLIGAAHANSCSCWLPFQGLQERCYRGFPEPLLSLVLVSSFSQESYQLIPVINTPLF